MDTVRRLRESRGWSQRALARKAGMAYKTLQLIESDGHDPRISTLTRIARALGVERSVLLRGAGIGGEKDSVVQISAQIREKGEDSWKLYLFNLVDAFHRKPAVSLVEAAPVPGLSHRVHALIASTIEHVASERGLRAPWWCAGVPALDDPWFVAGVESLKAAALVESPAAYRRRNIFVLGNFLRRA